MLSIEKAMGKIPQKISCRKICDNCRRRTNYRIRKRTKLQPVQKLHRFHFGTYGRRLETFFKKNNVQILHNTLSKYKRQPFIRLYDYFRRLSTPSDTKLSKKIYIFFIIGCTDDFEISPDRGPQF